MWFDVGKGGHFYRVFVDYNKMLIFAKSMMMMMMTMMMMMMLMMLMMMIMIL